MTHSKSFLPTACLLAALLLNACVKDESGEPEPRPLPALSIEDAQIEETNSTQTLTLRVSIEGLNLTNVVVDYHTQDGSAEAGSDYVPISEGKLLFTPADREMFIELQILGDDFEEEDETFQVVLTDPHNAELVKAGATVTILDEDTQPGNPFGIPNSGYSSPTEYPGMTMVWSDEFDGDNLNTANWNFEIGTGNNGWGNNELQYYREENTFLYEGFLLIEAREEPFANSDYTSSRITTKDKQEFQFGRIDIRAALPEGRGFWPALWMLGTNIDQVGWPACGEIDIMELLGHQPGTVFGTAHFGVSVAQHQFRSKAYTLSGGEKFSQEFHVFSLVWEQDRLQYLVDDQLFHEVTPADLNGQPWPFNQPFFFIFNLAVGGNLPGPPDETTIFPQRLIVDYVRVFQ